MILLNNWEEAEFHINVNQMRQAEDDSVEHD